MDTCPQAANHCALFEFENELKFYNLEARTKNINTIQKASNNKPATTNIAALILLLFIKCVLFLPLCEGFGPCFYGGMVLDDFLV